MPEREAPEPAEPGSTGPDPSGPGSVEPGSAEPGPAGGAEPDAGRHEPEGLDLARAMMRGTVGGPPADGRSRRRTPWKGGTGGTGGRSWRRPRAHEIPTSGAHPGERDPQLLGAEVARIIDDHGWALDLQVRGVFARWAEIVGEEIGAHSTPESLTDGILVVRTDSTAWATQLKLLAATVVKRLNAELGDGTVTVVEVLGPAAPSWKHGRLGTRDGRGPRDTYG